MLVENLMEMLKNLFSLKQIGAGIETDSALILEEINRELEAYLLEERDDADSTDVFNFLTTLSNQVEGEFEELLDSNSNKKCFLRALSKMFTLLLNTKVDTAVKMKKILKIAIETTTKICSEPRSQ